jgi:hypothetical protein
MIESTGEAVPKSGQTSLDEVRVHTLAAYVSAMDRLDLRGGADAVWGAGFRCEPVHRADRTLEPRKAGQEQELDRSAGQPRQVPLSHRGAHRALHAGKAAELWGLLGQNAMLATSPGRRPNIPDAAGLPRGEARRSLPQASPRKLLTVKNFDSAFSA